MCGDTETVQVIENEPEITAAGVAGQTAIIFVVV